MMKSRYHLIQAKESHLDLIFPAMGSNLNLLQSRFYAWYSTTAELSGHARNRRRLY
jgi:hypothetical protein